MRVARIGITIIIAEVVAAAAAFVLWDWWVLIVAAPVLMASVVVTIVLAATLDPSLLVRTLHHPAGSGGRGAVRPGVFTPGGGTVFADDDWTRSGGWHVSSGWGPPGDGSSGWGLVRRRPLLVGLRVVVPVGQRHGQRQLELLVGRRLELLVELVGQLVVVLVAALPRRTVAHHGRPAARDHQLGANGDARRCFPHRTDDQRDGRAASGVPRAVARDARGRASAASRAA